VIVEHAHMTKLPGYYVEAVIEAPFGAHPTSHVPAYGMDAWELMDYVVATSDGDGYADYISRLRSETEDEYRERVLGNGRGAVLRELVQQPFTLELSEEVAS